MDAVSYSHSAKQAQRIEKFIKDPDSDSGIVTVPKVIGAGESVTVPAGRIAVLPNVQVDGTLNVEGEVFIPSGATSDDLESKIAQRSEKLTSNITVNVGPNETYKTINEALEYLTQFYPVYKQSGITATINLKAGFVMAEQVLVSGIDLGWITIVGEDAETIITHTALTTAFNVGYPAFGVDKGGTSPIIGQLFRFNVEKVGGNKHGLVTFGAGSSANVLTGKGFIGAGTLGIYAAAGSAINADGANASNAGYAGIYAANGSTINASGANASNAGSSGMYADFGATINSPYANASNAGSRGIYAGVKSTINAFKALIQNQTTGTFRIVVAYGSTIEATEINTTGGTAPVFSQAINTLTSNGIIYQ